MIAPQYNHHGPLPHLPDLNILAPSTQVGNPPAALKTPTHEHIRILFISVDEQLFIPKSDSHSEDPANARLSNGTRRVENNTESAFTPPKTRKEQLFILTTRRLQNEGDPTDGRHVGSQQNTNC